MHRTILGFIQFKINKTMLNNPVSYITRMNTKGIEQYQNSHNTTDRTKITHILV
jgi:hypothetical protein